MNSCNASVLGTNLNATLEPIFKNITIQKSVVYTYGTGQTKLKVGVMGVVTTETITIADPGKFLRYICFSLFNAFLSMQWRHDQIRISSYEFVSLALRYFFSLVPPKRKLQSLGCTSVSCQPTLLRIKFISPHRRALSIHWNIERRLSELWLIRK